MEKITKREMFEAIIEGVEAGSFKYDVEDIKAFCENEIALLDKKAAKAKELVAKKRKEGDELTDAVRTALSADTFEPIAEIAARIEGDDVTIAKVTYRLTTLVKNGEAEKQEITITAGEGTKARKVQGYKKIEA